MEFVDQGTFNVRAWTFPKDLTPSPDADDELKSVSDTSLSFHSVPWFVNTVFIIGKNGSGKSLLLAKWALQCGYVTLVRPMKVIDKDEPADKYGQNRHRRVKLPTTDDTVLRKLSKEMRQQLYDEFRNATASEWIPCEQDTTSKMTSWELVFMRGTSGIRLPYEDISDGLRQAFRLLLWSISQPTTPAVFVLDEPESNLHPRLYTGLFDAIFRRHSHHAKFVIATHDFHLIETISRRDSFRSVVFEASATPFIRSFPAGAICTPPRKTSVSPMAATSPGAGVLDNPLQSTISTRCLSRAMFALQSSRIQYVSYSPELLLDMIGESRIVLYVEGTYDKSDYKIFSRIFDPDKVQVRATEARTFEKRDSGKNKSEVFKKITGLLSSADVLRFELPSKYYGLCDLDRNFRQKPDRCVAQHGVPELENLYWTPPMFLFWRKLAVQQFGAAGSDKRFSKFFDTFRERVRNGISFFTYEYACHLLESRVYGRPTSFRASKFEVATAVASLTAASESHSSTANVIIEMVRVLEQSAAVDDLKQQDAKELREIAARLVELSVCSDEKDERFLRNYTLLNCKPIASLLGDIIFGLSLEKKLIELLSHNPPTDDTTSIRAIFRKYFECDVIYPDGPEFLSMKEDLLNAML